jgi:phosphatidylserine/phosphatidylglycerophosphate/cardiolipin synthase-like enzyme
MTSRNRLWPAPIAPDFVDVPVAIARTLPPRGRHRGVREIRALNMAALAAARRSIYIETQYFADRQIGRILAAHLARPDGPEVVIVIPRSAHGFVEGWIMNGNRDRVIRMLKRADRFDRLRVFFPVVADEGREDCEIFVHAKLVIVDDCFLRVGSSNLNRRSTGLDAECDLAIEATDDDVCARIAAIRARLLGEHLGVRPAAVQEALAREGRLIAAIDALNTHRRTLRRYLDVSREGPTHLMFGTRLLDPRGPLRLASLFGGRRARLSSDDGRRTGAARAGEGAARRFAPLRSRRA